MITSQKALFQNLNGSAIDYIALSEVGVNSASIIFTGNFENKPVIWQALLVAMDSKERNKLPQYIEIPPQEKDVDLCVAVEIGLHVTAIDEPTIVKAIKMIQQFKNLQRGRHEFSGPNK